MMTKDDTHVALTRHANDAMMDGSRQIARSDGKT